MNKKFFAIFTIVAIFVSAFSLNSVFAKNDKNQDIPEIDGIYDVPGHPEMKVRVFVHNEKPAKPGKPAPTLPQEVCGLTDPESLSVVDYAGWKLPANWSYNLNLGGVPALVGSGNWSVIVENSFNAWINEVDGAVNITRGLNTTVSKKALDGKNIVAWGLVSPSVLGVTYIWYYPSTGDVVELDTIMNKKFTWAWSDSINCAFSGIYDAQNILTHEIGHWFGLDDHYTNDYTNNTMYGYGFKTEVKKDTLTLGDIAGLNSIY